jgi:hypothetical protein
MAVDSETAMIAMNSEIAAMAGSDCRIPGLP